MRSNMQAAACFGVRGGLGRILFVLLAAILIHPSALEAQVQPVEPYYAVVTRDDVPMRCKDGAPYYPVRMLERGQVVRVDGESPWWVRVHYLPGMHAFVKADEVRVDDSARELVLTRPSRLMASNVAGGERGNWWYLLDEELPAGTRLPIARTLRTADDRVFGYLVPAPGDARGYIRQEVIRHATSEEVERYRAALAGEGTPDPETPDPDREAEQEAERRAERERERQREEEEAARREAEREREAQREQRAGEKPDDPEVPDPTGTEAERETPAAEEITMRPAEPDDVRRDAEGLPVASVETLSELFEESMRAPIREVELDEVIGEFRRKIDVLREPGATDADRRLAQMLRARLDALTLRQELQESIFATEQSTRRLDERTEHVARVVREAERQQAYAIVGRLVPSTVYDGSRLPLMYRIQSVDTGFSRTIGYITPTAELELDGKLGRVVGVVGHARYDGALRVNVVTPRRVDVLEAAAAGAP